MEDAEETVDAVALEPGVDAEEIGVDVAEGAFSVLGNGEGEVLMVFWGQGSTEGILVGWTWSWWVLGEGIGRIPWWTWTRVEERGGRVRVWSMYLFSISCCGFHCSSLLSLLLSSHNTPTATNLLCGTRRRDRLRLQERSRSGATRDPELAEDEVRWPVTEELRGRRP